ncbi:MAG: 2Fe-2S iron-sulfur cluster binding domain-containing protein [Rhodanobacteraceae bacterium]|nr:2Fe-2S iron-sulfur cluster binding domain-containing protein [Rhodanobacteraceae bacterium]
MPSIEYQGKRYGAEPGESVLEALLRQGAVVSHSCRKGSCHACVLKRERGEVRHSRDIDPSLARDGHILSCVAIPQGDVVLAAADMAHRSIAAEVVHRRPLAEDVVELGIAPAQDIDFLAGQHVQVLRADELSRPYSIASVPGEDYYFRIQVRRVADGAMSRWLCDEVQPGQKLALRRPLGDCCYRPSMRERPLLLLATGTGVGALAALARQALGDGHAAPVTLYHGARRMADLYLHAELHELQRRHPHFRYVPCLTREAAPAGVRAGRVTEAALADHPDLQPFEVFLCGLPAMVQEARYRAILAGAQRARIHADPFEFAHPPAPRDAEKIAAIAADPALWAALEQGPGLSRILATFYDRVYEDARLSPFFQGVAKPFVIQKQYEFLAKLFSGETGYFGLNPYNAHHWMVISDELFDYREALFETVLHEYGLDRPLIRRWMALQELFRAEIVKPAARGIISEGTEHPLRTHVVECLDIEAVCDGCGQAIPARAPSRYHYRVGHLHCADCAGIELSARA